MHLDDSRLPKAIQVEAIRSEDWHLASEDFVWKPKVKWLPEILNQ